MTRGAQAIRSVAVLVMWAGFAVRKASTLLQSASRRLSPERGWRTVEAADVTVRVPPDWGDVETDSSGGMVIHNRPRRFRVDGDAVWYSSAIELRIRPAGCQPSRSAEAMTVETRTVAGGSGPIVLELRIANGVGPLQRRVARRVLGSAKPMRRTEGMIHKQGREQ